VGSGLLLRFCLLGDNQLLPHVPWRPGAYQNVPVRACGEHNQIVTRSIPFTTSCFFFFYTLVQLMGGLDPFRRWKEYLVGWLGPSSLAACACALLLTSPPSAAATMPAAVRPPRGGGRRGLFWTRLRSFCCRPDAAASGGGGSESVSESDRVVNQFGCGQANFNVVALCLVAVPAVASAVAYIPRCFEWAERAATAKPQADVRRLQIEYLSYMFGWMSVMCLSFFLIPVTRHSVLLAAAGWSPVHALRIHIWAGYASFAFMLLHGAILVPVWFAMYEYPVWQQVVPDRRCWTFVFTDDVYQQIQPSCYRVFANWTGLLAAAFYVALWGTSLNWVRRRNYRLFYGCHVVLGTLTILGMILHMHWIVLLLVPSITYYLASTCPTLVQALASRCRGGVSVRAVRAIPHSNGCVEVHLDADGSVLAQLKHVPCRFVKICVPELSLVWHPFDVYTAPSISDDGPASRDGSTLRLLFRPVGPFTKGLARSLTSTRHASRAAPPATVLVDGLYGGAEKCRQALRHDCVTLVAGGVAVTPYLSLLPALLRRMTELSPHCHHHGDEECTTKKVRPCVFRCG
jgi:predicted ferric reductase